MIGSACLTALWTWAATKGHGGTPESLSSPKMTIKSPAITNVAFTVAIPDDAPFNPLATKYAAPVSADSANSGVTQTPNIAVTINPISTKLSARRHFPCINRNTRGAGMNVNAHVDAGVKKASKNNTPKEISERLSRFLSFFKRHHLTLFYTIGTLNTIFGELISPN